MAGSRRSFFISETLNRHGDEVWITTSNGGSDLMASSKANSLATSWTMTKSSFSLVIPACALKISAPFSRDLTLVTTECPCSSKILRICVAMKPLPPVFFYFSVNSLRRLNVLKARPVRNIRDVMLFKKCVEHPILRKIYRRKEALRINWFQEGLRCTAQLEWLMERSSGWKWTQPSPAGCLDQDLHSILSSSWWKVW